MPLHVDRVAGLDQRFECSFFCILVCFVNCRGSSSGAQLFMGVGLGQEISECLGGISWTRVLERENDLDPSPARAWRDWKRSTWRTNPTWTFTRCIRLRR